MTLAEARVTARRVSLMSENRGCSFHINYSILKVGYEVSDWYDSHNTVATYMDGKSNG